MEGGGVTATHSLETGAGDRFEADPQLRLLDPADSQQNSRSVWQRRYVAALWLLDALVVGIAVGIAQLARFGTETTVVSTAAISGMTYTATSVALVLLWLSMLTIHRTRSPRVIGNGAEEYRRIVVATLQLFGLVAIVSMLFHLEIARGYLAIAFPAGLLGLLTSRWLTRKAVARRRVRGRCSTSVLVVGSRQSVLTMARSFERDSRSGYQVAGVCLPGHAFRDGDSVVVDEREIPILGDEYSVVHALRQCGADTVAVTATEQLGHEGIRRLVWELEPYDVDLVVAPGVVDVAGPRLVMRPVADLPLIHVEKPAYHGATRFTKAAFDRFGAAFLILLLLPVLGGAALAIKLTDRGPVFFRQVRIGQGGSPFRIWKFRSMIPDADARLAEIRSRTGQTDSTFYKSEKDPRITRVGRVLRRTSMDELPQLFNVLSGTMSLVGPRPLAPGEGAEIEGFVERRMLVRPGMTGLWQVSGRSELPPAERIRLDLYYVENWSMMQDLLIMWRTVRAVLTSDGAY
ncbi:exopolysaccharide biosynthesis polyprenyl glycosylphosphotransferase [Rhodococcus hoagii]|nr:exopolysaccharide biosynthesis polyprenyl glycosylphosphotransferase [Prescottella equi]